MRLVLILRWILATLLVAIIILLWIGVQRFVEAGTLEMNYDLDEMTAYTLAMFSAVLGFTYAVFRQLIWDILR